MIINNNDLNYYVRNGTVKLIGYSVANPNISANTFNNGIDFPIYYDTDFGTQELTIKLFCEGETIEELNTSVSELLATLKGVNDIRLDMDESISEISYKTIYNKHSIEKLSPTACIITFSMIADRVKAWDTICVLMGLTKYSIRVLGTKKTKPIITITLPISITEFTYNDITISNISNSDENATKNIIVINSEDCLITLNGENNFINCDLIDFPKFEIGINNITVSSALATVKISYRERYI